MTTTDPHDPTLHVLEVPGARLSYGVRGDLASCGPQSPPVLLAGSPMDSTGFTTLASHLADRVVVTYDPRNTGRSSREDPTAPVDTGRHAEDLHLLVEALGVGPVDVFGSSGGAVNALALVAAHPHDVRILVAQEPPLVTLLPDRAEAAAALGAVVDSYDRSGIGPALAMFIRLVGHRGPVTREYLARAAPDPAAFGLPAEDDGSRDDPLVANLRGGFADTVLDADAVRASAVRIVIGVGEESGGPTDGELAARAAHRAAAVLAAEAVGFPGGHNGFLGGEYGQHGRPEEFAATLRRVLAQASPGTVPG